MILESFYSHGCIIILGWGMAQPALTHRWITPPQNWPCSAQSAQATAVAGAWEAHLSPKARAGMGGLSPRKRLEEFIHRSSELCKNSEEHLKFS